MISRPTALPRLMDTRPVAHQWLLGDLAPLVLGLVTGLVLDASSALYTLLLLLAAIGGLLAGLEHRGAVDGAARGEVGGLLFGLGLLLGHHLGGRAHASLPSPEILEVLITTIVGIGLGAAGGALRARRLRRAA